jgi:NADH-quinone oxidoreductase subunit A
MTLTPEIFVFFLLLFTVVGAVFLFIHLVIGSVIRPYVPDKEKLTIYECGEPTVGSAWVQFDLRYYVVALLFVIFDVEVAFFFPWATVFGKANELASLEDVRPSAVAVDNGIKSLPPRFEDLNDSEKLQQKTIDERRAKLSAQLMPTGLSNARRDRLELQRYDATAKEFVATPIKADAARRWARIAFWDIAVFFGVLMVGFAYLWRRGDLNWVKTYEPHQEPAIEPEHPLEQTKAVAPPQPVSAH